MATKQEIDTAFAAAVEIESKRIKTDCDHFIDNYGAVQDPDSEGGSTAFKLWPEQKRVLHEIQQNRLNIVLKARQLGLTWLVLWYALWCMIVNSGFVVVALSRRDEDAKELVNRLVFSLRRLPRWLTVENKGVIPGFPGVCWSNTAHEINIYREGGEVSRFIAMPAAQDSGRSFTAALVILDEWAFQQWATEIWTAAYPTINRPTGGKVIGLSTAKRMTLFHDIWDNAQDYGFHRIFLSWRADPRRTDAWYEQTIKALASGQKYLQEYPATAEEAFSAGEGTALAEFSRDIHVCEPFEIPSHWRRWMSGDNGYTDPFCWYWMAVSEDGQVFIYREYSRDYDDDKVYYSDQASKVMELSTYTDIEDGKPVKKHEKIDYIVQGMDAWSTHHRDQEGKNLIDYYRDGGISYGFIKPVTDRKLRLATWHEYLKPYEGHDGRMTAKVQMFSTCKHLIDSLPNLLLDDKNPEVVADCDIDHWYDGAGYGLIAYHMDKSKAPKQDKTPLEKHKEQLAKRMQMASRIGKRLM